MRGGARCDHELVQLQGGLFSASGERRARTLLARGDGKAATVSRIAVTHASPLASLEEHKMQH